MNAAPTPNPPAGRLLIFILAALAIASVALLVGVPAIQYLSEREIHAAEERVAFLEKNGASADELCRAKRAVQDAYLKKRDADGYRRARLYADVECHTAELDRLF